MGKRCKSAGVTDVIISSILTKNNSNINNLIRQLNDTLESQCSQHGLLYICNDKITNEYLQRDGVHLNYEGTCMLAGNFVDFLNYFILNVNSKVVQSNNLF